jgi:glycosyltransferase involved in cell wall biosynthesis
MQPVLSIITVTWNCVATLEKTLRSVAAIKTDEMEYIIVDGVSTDGTLELAQRYGTLVDTLQSEPDTGIYNAMNKGVALARGDYVLFINGDDALVADGFLTVMDALSRGVDKIICATTLVGDIASPSEILVACPWRLLFVNSIPHPSSFVYRDLLLRRPFREDLRIASDYDFFLGAYLAGQSFRVLTVPTALHQRGGASGDSHRSQAELECVRRDRLGWRYALVNGMAAIYRKSMRLLRKRTA